MARTLSARTTELLFLVVPLLLTGMLGLVALASLGLRSDPPNFTFATRQSIAWAIASMVFFVTARVDWRTWERGWAVVAIAVAALLVGVLVFGERLRGVRGWFAVGGWTLQVVEVAKIGAVLLFAAYFRWRARSLDRLRTVVESGALALTLVIPVLLQPDLGSATLIAATWLGMLFVFGLRRAHLIAIVFAGILALLLAWSALLKPYQRERIQSFLDPRRDPQGTGYNQRQAVIAVGAGGITGQGFGEGTQAQLRFLPEAHSDFLPAVIAEEFGLLGLTTLLACVAAVLMVLTRVARRCSDDFSVAVVVGIATLYGVETLVNIAVNLGIAPVMGVPFPFVSSGGSAMLAFAFGFGVVASIIARAPRAERRAYAFDVELR